MDTSEFTIYRTDRNGESVIVFGGTADATDAPIAFIADMREFGPQMAVGDYLNLNSWHYAIRTA